MNYGIIFLVLYLGLLIGGGVLSSRKVGSGDSDDFWVAGRSIGTVMLTMSMVASIMHGGSIISGVGMAAKFGGIAILPYVGFAGGMFVILVLFAKKLRAMEAVTLSDYMGKRYKSVRLHAFTAIVVAVSNILYLIAQIRGMGFILQGILGTTFEMAMVIGTVVLIGYVAAGGLRGAVMANVIQFSFMMIGLILLAPNLAKLTGGWTNAFVQADAVAPGWTSPTGTSWTGAYLISWILTWFVAYANRIELITKVFAAKDTKSARYAIPWTLLIVFAFLLYGNMYLGAAARVHVWDQITAPDQAFTALVTMTQPAIIAAISMVGIAAAAMSTTDALLLSGGAAIAHDLLEKCYYEPRGIKKSEKYYLNISRVTILSIGLIALLGAFNTPQMLLEIVSYAVALIGSTFFAPMVVGLLSKRVSTTAAAIGSVGGFLVCAVHVVLSLMGVDWALTIHPSVLGVGTSFVLLLGVNMFTRPQESEEINRIFFDGEAAEEISVPEVLEEA